MTEFEFHISPVCSWSRPQTSAGTSGTSSHDQGRMRGVVAHADGASDRLRDVGDDAVPPSADLVSEQPQVSRQRRAHRSFDHPVPLLPSPWDRGLLDDEPALGGEDDEG